MKKAMLPGDDGIVLMRRLATDDAFRDRFEADPASAMTEAGVSRSAIDNLDASCCQKIELAPKAHFAKLLDDVDSDLFQVAMSMHVQKLKI